MIRNKTLAGVAMVFSFFGCDSFKVAGQFQSGRQAFLAKNYEESLTFFQKVARADPNYIFESGLYRQGIWNYVGRAQYHTGKYSKHASPWSEPCQFIRMIIWPGFTWA
jgi:hypothetical protein